MRLSFRAGKYDTAGKHNDRNYDYEHDLHINSKKTLDNVYWDLTNGDVVAVKHSQKSVSFLKSERDFYKQQFNNHIKKSNATKLGYRRKDLTTTASKYYKGTNTSPEDVIFQFGDKRESISGELAERITEEYIKRFNEAFGKHCKIMNVALHLDEATPHVHIRRVWCSKDNKTNELCASKSQAFADIAEERGYTDSLRKLSSILVKEEKGLLYSIAREYGVDITTSQTLTGIYMAPDKYKETKDAINRIIHNLKQYSEYNTFTKYSAESAPVREQAVVLKLILDQAPNRDELIKHQSNDYDILLKTYNGINKHNASYKNFQKQIKDLVPENNYTNKTTEDREK